LINVNPSPEARVAEMQVGTRGTAAEEGGCPGSGPRTECSGLIEGLGIRSSRLVENSE
jgi:hypothetical protein